MNTNELQGAIERMVMDGEWLKLKELEALSDKLHQYDRLLRALAKLDKQPGIGSTERSIIRTAITECQH